jgi:hypothetical protein
MNLVRVLNWPGPPVSKTWRAYISLSERTFSLYIGADLERVMALNWPIPTRWQHFPGQGRNEVVRLYPVHSGSGMSLSFYPQGAEDRHFRLTARVDRPWRRTMEMAEHRARWDRDNGCFIFDPVD